MKRGDRSEHRSLLPQLRPFPSSSGPSSFVRVEVPMSVANVGPGFDTFGLCLDRPADVLEAHPASRLTISVEGDPSIPTDPRRNAASVSFRAFARQFGYDPHAELRLVKGCRGGSGIGSSGASAVAGAFACAALYHADLSRPSTAAALVRSALTGETAGSGSTHLDNVAASLFGGFTIAESLDPPIVHRLPFPRGVRAVIALPRYRLSTHRSRSVLPARVPRAHAVENLARAASMVHAVLGGDVEDIGRNMVDRIAEPYRRRLLPGLEEAREAARRAGAAGVALAGSGPALIAIARSRFASPVARALERGFARAGVEADAFISGPGTGARLLRRMEGPSR